MIDRYTVGLGMANLDGRGSKHELWHQLVRPLSVSSVVVAGPVDVTGFRAEVNGARTWLPLKPDETTVRGPHGHVVTYKCLNNSVLLAGSKLVLDVVDRSTERDHGRIMFAKRWPFVVRRPCVVTAACAAEGERFVS